MRRKIVKEYLKEMGRVDRNEILSEEEHAEIDRREINLLQTHISKSEKSIQRAQKAIQILPPRINKMRQRMEYLKGK